MASRSRGLLGSRWAVILATGPSPRPPRRCRRRSRPNGPLLVPSGLHAFAPRSPPTPVRHADAGAGPAGTGPSCFPRASMRSHHARPRPLLVALVLAAMLAAACTAASGQTGPTPTGTAGLSGSPSPGPEQTKLEQAKAHL